MPGPKHPEVCLTDVMRRGLEKLVKRYSTRQQIALRGRIILLAGNGLNNGQVARDLKISIDMARLWRTRWLVLEPIPLSDLSIEERLEDLPRPGAPCQITADQVCQIVALACKVPEESERPISHWTSREIADEIKKRGIVDEISPRHAARLLKRRRSQASPDPLLADRRS